MAEPNPIFEAKVNKAFLEAYSVAVANAPRFACLHEPWGMELLKGVFLRGSEFGMDEAAKVYRDAPNPSQ